MTTRRLISVVILLAFLPGAVGCSTTKSITLADDPGDSEFETRLQAGESIEISSYTRVDDGRRKWAGFVRTAPPDSLHFDSKPAAGSPSISFRLARVDVVSIKATEFSAGKTQALVAASLVVVGIVGWSVAIATSDFGM